MNRQLPILIFAVVCISFVAVQARLFGGIANDDGFSGGNPFASSRLYQNWKQYNGLDKRFRFDGNDRFGSAKNRFVDWSQIIGSGRTKKDFDTGASDGFGLYRAPIGKQRLDLDPSDFSKKSTNDDGENAS